MRSWGGAADAFEVIRAPSDQSEAWTMELRARCDPGFAIRVEKSVGDPRVRLMHRLEVPAETARQASERLATRDQLGRAVAAIEAIRAGTVTCVLRADKAGGMVEIEVIVYDDGFSRHALNAAVLEIVKARRALQARFDSVAAFSRFAAELDRTIADQQGQVERLQATASQHEAAPLAEMVNQCAHCGVELRAGDKFCSKCGAPVRVAPQSSGPSAPAIGTSPFAVPSLRACRQCGRQFSANQDYCPGCGTRVA
jgi:hypothetical protein